MSLPFQSSFESRAGSSRPRLEPVGVSSQPSSQRALMLPVEPCVRPRSKIERPRIAISSRRPALPPCMTTAPAPSRRNPARRSCPILSASAMRGSLPRLTVHGTPGSICGPIAQRLARRAPPPPRRRSRRRRRPGGARRSRRVRSAIARERVLDERRRALRAELRLYRGDLRRFRRRIDQDGLAGLERGRDPDERLAATAAGSRLGAAGRARSAGCRSAIRATCWRVAAEQLPASTAGLPPAAGSFAASVRGCIRPAGEEVLRQSERDAGAGGHERRDRRTPRRCHQVLVGERVDDRDTRCRPARERVETRTDRRRTAAHGARSSTSPTLRCVCRAQHAHEVCVGHRRERVILHRRFGQQHVADEEMALVDGAAVLRETPGRRS